MAELEAVTRWIYIRHTNPRGEISITSHIVWDAELFFDALTARTAKENRELVAANPRGAGIHKFSVITREAYLEHLSRKRTT